MNWIDTFVSVMNVAMALTLLLGITIWTLQLVVFVYYMLIIGVKLIRGTKHEDVD